MNHNKHLRVDFIVALKPSDQIWTICLLGRRFEKIFSPAVRQGFILRCSTNFFLSTPFGQ